MLTSFSDEKIISLLEIHSLWGRRACREILRRKDDFIPLLVNILEEAARDPDLFMDGEKDSLIPAAFLLAHMRAAAAYPHLVSLLSYDEETLDFLWGDVITEQYPRMLRDTFNGEAFLLPKVIEDRAVGPWARAMAVKAWGMHYFDGYLTREEIIGCFRHLMGNVYARKTSEDDQVVLCYIVNCIKEHQLEELLDDVKAIYARGGIDTDICGDLDEYERDFKNPAHKLDDTHIDDAIKELEGWGWFKEKEHGKKAIDQNYGDEETIRKTYKPGRNEPCPCGSGKKHKNCCLGVK
ncbi:MAG: DUF1186 domain-containing protein [Treponema sp.]|nr:DUF1186 domain-containing protein [Treponema sp.]